MRPSTFTLGKLAQIRYPEAGEFFGIIFSLFRSPVQIAGAVLCVDVRMRRPVHRPAVVSAALLTATSSTILNSLDCMHTVAGNSAQTRKFPFSTDASAFGRGTPVGPSEGFRPHASGRPATLPLDQAALSPAGAGTGSSAIGQPSMNSNWSERRNQLPAIRRAFEGTLFPPRR
jgi:hypothetical protein